MTPLAHTGRQRGAGLIEVLISLTIGLVILTAVGVGYISSSNLMRQYEDQNELNEPARFALDIMRRHIEMAGYVDLTDGGLVAGTPLGLLLNPNPQTRRLFERRARDDGTIATPIGLVTSNAAQPLVGCDGRFTDVGACGSPASATEHSLRVAFQMVPGVAPLPANAVNPSLRTADNTTGDGSECTGTAVVANLFAPPIITTEFFINDSSVPGQTAVSQLSCRRVGRAADALVAGAEELVFRYQVAPLGAEGQAAGGSAGRYLTAAQVRTAATNPAGWAGVTAVEICLVMATPVTRGAAAAGTAALQPKRPTCNPSVAGGMVDRANDDVRLWKRFTTVANLRNAVYATPH